MDSARAMVVSFTAYGQSLERVEVFKSLGRLLVMDDNDMPLVRALYLPVLIFSRLVASTEIN